MFKVIVFCNFIKEYFTTVFPFQVLRLNTSFTNLSVDTTMWKLCLLVIVPVKVLS